MQVKAILLAGAMALIPVTSLAQAPATPAYPTHGGDVLTVRAAEIDTSIPEAPGFAVVGVTPTTVIDPSASRITLSTIAGYVDGNGNLKPGLAFGGLPYLWLHPNLTLTQYRNLPPFEALLARTQFSAAFADGGDGQPDKIGVGLTVDVFGNDYRHDRALYQCVNDVYAPMMDSLRADRGDRRRGQRAKIIVDRKLEGKTLTADQEFEISNAAEAAVTTEELDAIRSFQGGVGLKHCREQAKERYAKRTSLVLAGGWAVKSDNGFERATSDGGSFWGALRIPIVEMPTQILGRSNYVYATFFGRYDVDRKQEITTNVFQGYNRVSLAALGGYDAPHLGMKLSLEAGYERLNFDAGPMKDEEAGFWAATLSKRLGEVALLGDAWLDLKAGSGLSPADPSARDDRIRVSIRFGAAEKKTAK